MRVLLLGHDAHRRGIRLGCPLAGAPAARFTSEPLVAAIWLRPQAAVGSFGLKTAVPEFVVNQAPKVPHRAIRPFLPRRRGRGHRGRSGRLDYR